MLCIYAVSFSQEQNENYSIEKGHWNLRGNVNFSTSKNDFENKSQEYSNSTNSTYISLISNIGYSVNTNLVVGLGVGYGFNGFKDKNDGLGKVADKQFSYSVFPYVKKYFSVGKKLLLDVEGSVGFNLNKRTHEPENTETKVYGYYASLTPGVTYFLNKKWALEANLGAISYSVSKDNNDGKSSTVNSFVFALNPSYLSFGASYFFN